MIMAAAGWTTPRFQHKGGRIPMNNPALESLGGREAVGHAAGNSGAQSRGGRRRLLRPVRPLHLLLAAPASRLTATYRRGLKLAGHQVTHASSAGAAIDQALPPSPALAIVDTDLPDAIEVLRTLRSHDSPRAVPVVVLEAGDAEELRQEAADLVIADWLPRRSTSPYALAHWLAVWAAP
jgi:CheY-like chemotaxis protein